MLRLRSKIIVFLITFVVVFLMLHAIVRLQVARQTHIYVQEINSIHKKIEDRFKLFIDAPLAVGITSATYLGQTSKNSGEYEKLAQKVVNIFPELLGLSLLNENGEIVGVYPPADNPGALGKITQNFAALKLSYKKNEAYWLSPPFDLYQGSRGFVFYVPMIKDGELVGWIAPIISIERFFTKFIKLEFLESFHLVIQDIQTGDYYFTTAELPKNKKSLHINYGQIRGREMLFTSWRKEKILSDHDHWPFSGLISLILGLIAVYTYWLFEQKSQSKKQLEDVNTLLGITSRDTSAALDGIQHQLNLMKQGSVPVSIEKITHHVASITTMIQQITVLQRIAIPGITPPMQDADLRPLMKEVAEKYDSFLVQKSLFLDLPEDETKVVVNCNKWLISHSVLGSILCYVAGNADNNSVIKITLMPQKLTFSFEGEVSPEVLNGYLDHGLYVAQQVMNIHQGSLTFGRHSIDVNFKI
jgi:sensor domain CHASE-containing protein